MTHSTIGKVAGLLMLGLASYAHGQVAKCTLADVRVMDLKASSFGQSATRVVGRLVNGCELATGAEVRFVFRRADGTEVYAEEAWPVSLSNVDARGELPFEVMLGRAPAFDRVEAAVIRLKTWAPGR